MNDIHKCTKLSEAEDYLRSLVHICRLRAAREYIVCFITSLANRPRSYNIMPFNLLIKALTSSPLHELECARRFLVPSYSRSSWPALNSPFSSHVCCLILSSFFFKYSISSTILSSNLYVSTA